jgi:hypothetical protein
MRLYCVPPNISAYAFKLVFAVFYIQIKHKIESKHLVLLIYVYLGSFLYISNKLIAQILKRHIKHRFYQMIKDNRYQFNVDLSSCPSKRKFSSRRVTWPNFLYWVMTRLGQDRSGSLPKKMGHDQSIGQWPGPLTHNTIYYTNLILKQITQGIYRWVGKGLG